MNTFKILLVALSVVCLHFSQFTQAQSKPGRLSIGTTTTVHMASSVAVYALPFKAEDLNPGERYSTGNHAGGSQALGEDFGAKRYLGNGKWTGLKAGTNNSKNSDAVMYNKPFYAMEDGEVCACWRNAPENPKPGEAHPALGQNKMAGGGNFVLVLHNDGRYALYAHAIPGTVPTNVCPYNDQLFPQSAPGHSFFTNPNPYTFIPEGQRPKVKKGQLLGKAGNSGSSSGTHLHVHVIDDKAKASPMKFEKGMTTPYSNGNANINQWTPLNGNSLPDDGILIWPPTSVKAEYTRHQFNANDFQRMFDHLADSGYELEWIDGYSVKNKAYLNFSWKPATGKLWKAHFGLTGAAYQNAFDNRGTLSPTFVDSYTINGQPRYNVIFKKVSGGFTAKHGLTYNQHMNVMSTAKGKGLEPVNISVAIVNNQRKYTVLYRNMNYGGGFKVKSQVKESDYQALFNSNKAAGYTPVYINSYKFSGSVYLTIVFAKNGGGALKAKHGMTAAQVQTQWQSAVNAGYRTKMIAGCDGAASNHRFAALWRK